MTQHRDGFIPEYLLEQLAKEGQEEAKKTLKQMKNIKEKQQDEKKTGVRASQPGRINHANEVTGQAARYIYDSEHTDEFKRKLVRGEGAPPAPDDTANKAYEYAGATLTYIKEKLKLNSLDNRGLDINFNIHYGTDFVNAFWLGKDEEQGVVYNQMVFGDGDGRNFLSFVTLDVVAHEMAHAITEFSNHLEYEFQSGALNEHFSDVIGSAIKQHIKGQTAQTADWLIGDETVGPEWGGVALRSMKAPGTAHPRDNQPDHWDNFRELSLSMDRGGVHINSGIPNKAFYLTSQEIGTDNAAFLWHSAWPKLDENSTFSQAFDIILSTAQQLTNNRQLPANTFEAVKKAIQAVGIKVLQPV
ncbi:M4 family metallopeptidase [Paenibacillus donghaensis]|uniref:Neutral metalloproteinase n=1 Tax=Paenibacillus donghaensis TaxID=414771 RepID=A0A2Z2KJA6_9BACL|nr:M4 family metallopeptidase [Paenibacillus donghaensis]ASA23343.1 hypothetical protein B9T62_22570 [Paenibacillus donghaensis]